MKMSGFFSWKKRSDAVMLATMNSPWIFRISAVMLAMATLGSGGCTKIREIKERKAAYEKKQIEKKKKEEDQREISRKSDQIWEESSQEKVKELKGIAGPSEKALDFGGQSLMIPGLTLILGKLKVPDDPYGGQEPSQLRSIPSGIPSINLSNLPIEGAVEAKDVMGQMINLTSEIAENSELISGDGKKWRFTDGAIQFLRFEQGAMFISIDGNVVDASGENFDKVRVRGEIQAKVELSNSPVSKESD